MEVTVAKTSAGASPAGDIWAVSGVGLEHGLADGSRRIVGTLLTPSTCDDAVQTLCLSGLQLRLAVEQGFLACKSDHMAEEFKVSLLIFCYLTV